MKWVMWHGGSLKGMRCYAVLETCLLRWKIIRRIVYTTAAVL